MTELEEMKTQLWDGRRKAIADKKSDPWTLKQLEIVLKGLKNNQTRDPNELINEIFKPPIAGKDFKLAILHFMNKIKQTMYIPNILQTANITTILLL